MRKEKSSGEVVVKKTKVGGKKNVMAVKKKSKAGKASMTKFLTG